MQTQLKLMKKKKEKSTPNFSLDFIHPFPFDKNMYMPYFPKGLEMPQFDKYKGTKDPQDHLREFGALSMEFMQDQTYLMLLFSGSLGGQAME